MATVHLQPGRPFWFCAFSIFDADTGTNKRVFRSTKTRDKKRALEICRTWNKAAALARKDKLSQSAAADLINQSVKDVRDASEKNKIGETFARNIIKRGVFDVYQRGNLESLETQRISERCN